MSLADIRQELIRLCKAKMGSKMGALYEDTVVLCLDGGLVDGRGESAVFSNFMERVAGPLGSMDNLPI